MQTIQKQDLKRLQLFDMTCEFGCINRRHPVLAPFYIGQLPLPRGTRDLVRDIALCRVAGKNDFCTAGIIKNGIQNPWIMVMKIAETGKIFRVAKPGKKPQWIPFALVLRPTQCGVPIGVTDEMRIERLAVTRDTIKRIQIGL